MNETSPNPDARRLGQLMPLEDTRYPCIVMRKTCAARDQYLGRLPAAPEELAEYKRNCGMDSCDVYVL